MKAGTRVRVKGDCPHTLPSYARMMIGELLGPAEPGSWSVMFGASDRVFPIPTECLVIVEE